MFTEDFCSFLDPYVQFYLAAGVLSTTDNAKKTGGWGVAGVGGTGGGGGAVWERGTQTVIFLSFVRDEAVVLSVFLRNKI